EDRVLVANLQQHIRFLASDSLVGRRTGTKGEKLAAQYIGTAFKNIGLLPKGTDGYYQPFSINEGRGIGAATHLIINKQPLTIQQDFFPFSYSSDTAITAMPSVALQELKMP